MDRRTFGEVLRRVIDHVVGPERSNEVFVRAAAHRVNVRPEMLRELHGEHAEAAGGFMDEHPFAGLHVRPAQKVERARSAHEHGAVTIAYSPRPASSVQWAPLVAYTALRE